MRAMFCFLLTLAFTSFGLADDLGKTKKFKHSSLPKAITATTADVIVVVVELKPADVKSVQVSSSNLDVKIRAVEMDGEVRIVITGEKKGTSKVGWNVEPKCGPALGVIDYEIKIE